MNESDAGASGRLGPLLTPVLDEVGLELDDVELRPAGRRTVLRVIVDHEDGANLDQIAEATSSISRLLDDSDLMGAGSYTLEVTSPGVDRPLTQPRHWRRNRGRLVKVVGPDGTQITGRVVSADDDAAELDVDGSVVSMPYADVAVARVQVEFARLDDPDPAASARRPADGER